MNGFQQALERITDADTRRRIRQEEQMAEALVDTCLTRGYYISVHDGEEWPVILSNDKATIMAALFATDEDTLVIHDEASKKIGWFWLLYGNSGWDVVADYSASRTCDEIWEQVLMPLSDKLEASA